MLHLSYFTLLFGLGKCACYATVSTFDNDIIYKTDRPVVGVLVQDMDPAIDEQWPGHTGYIPGSYVKFVEGGGARAVPIW